MLALPPFQIMQIAAELKRCCFNSSDGQSVGKRCPTSMAAPTRDLLGFDCPVPGNAPVTTLVQARGIHGTDGIAGARMPVRAVCPMVRCDLETADFTVRHGGLIGRGIPPDASIATVEPASAAIIRSTVGQTYLLKCCSGTVAQNECLKYVHQTRLAPYASRA
jgi:hypothetical protein